MLLMLVFSCVYSWGFSHGWDDPGGLALEGAICRRTLCFLPEKKMVSGHLSFNPLILMYFFLSWWSGIVYWA